MADVAGALTTGLESGWEEVVTKDILGVDPDFDHNQRLPISNRAMSTTVTEADITGRFDIR